MLTVSHPRIFLLLQQKQHETERKQKNLSGRRGVSEEVATQQPVCLATLGT